MKIKNNKKNQNNKNNKSNKKNVNVKRKTKKKLKRRVKRKMSRKMSKKERKNLKMIGGTGTHPMRLRTHGAVQSQEKNNNNIISKRWKF